MSESPDALGAMAPSAPGAAAPGDASPGDSAAAAGAKAAGSFRRAGRRKEAEESGENRAPPAPRSARGRGGSVRSRE